jgi:hypothetical protein
MMQFMNKKIRAIYLDPEGDFIGIRDEKDCFYTFKRAHSDEDLGYIFHTSDLTDVKGIKPVQQPMIPIILE